MADEKRIDEGTVSDADTDDVEAHGAKKVVGVGLATAALLGAGAGAVKLAGDDEQPSQRIAGALTTSRGIDLKAADRDQDGYLTYRELADAGMKWGVEGLNAEGIEVTAEGLAAAGYKHALELVGAEGFALEGDTIMLKARVDHELDGIVEGSALEWSMKLREIDRDADGYAGYEELTEAGYKMNVDELKEAGYDVTPEELAKAGYKVELEAFGEGGFVTKDDMVMLKYGVDTKLDAFIRGE